MSNPRNIEKRLAFETLLDQGRVRIWVDRLTEWVDVPSMIEGFGPEGRIVALNYSKQFHMPQFKVTDTGVTATLSFNNRPHMTIVPWEAVLVMIQNEEVMETWHEDLLVAFKDIQKKQFVVLHRKIPQHTQRAPETVVTAPEDPEMSKWFTGTVAEG